MLGEKLILLLLSFSRYELNRLRKFLESPYHNEQEEVLQLFDLCNAALRKSPDTLRQLSREQVWKQIYPGKKLDETQLRRLASDLTRLALEFMTAEARKEHAAEDLLELQRVLEKPELSKHLSGVERQLNDLLDTEERSTWHYLYQFRMYWNIYSRSTQVVSKSDTYMDKLAPADFHLDSFYITQKLKQYVTWLYYKGFRSTESDIPLFPGFWEYAQSERFADVPLIAIYNKLVLCMQEHENEEHYSDLIRLLDLNRSRLTRPDLRSCYQFAQNYCALKVNQGKVEYYPVFFELYTKVIQDNIVLENNQLNEGVFKNIITISLRVGQYQWAENFIQEYSQYLPPSIRENARTFNLANLYSHQKMHDKVIELLRNVEYNDVVYALGSKLILLRTYYETSEYLALDSLIDSFRIFLRRNKVIAKNLKSEYNNFLNFVKKLTTLDPRNGADIEKFRQKVMAASSATPKKWLLEKIDELKK